MSNLYCFVTNASKGQRAIFRWTVVLVCFFSTLPATPGKYDPSPNPAGMMNTSSDGIIFSNDSAAAIALQTDGKIVVAGSAQHGNINFALARYNLDGSPDTSFGTEGKVVTRIGESGTTGANALTLQADGKIVVVGSSLEGMRSDFTLVRYNPDGSLDTRFGKGGTVTTRIDPDTTVSYMAVALALQVDGKLVVAGNAWDGTSNSFAVARYNPDGSVDTGFGVGGRERPTLDLALAFMPLLYKRMAKSSWRDHPEAMVRSYGTMSMAAWMRASVRVVSPWDL